MSLPFRILLLKHGNKIREKLLFVGKIAGAVEMKRGGARPAVTCQILPLQIIIEKISTAHSYTYKTDRFT